jgi:phosphatidylserine/phosphatidylglycerophosphate/cardiolipin synthase-like enzyme
VAEALARAQARGVAVRLALDRESVASPPMGKWAGIVEDAKIPIAWEDSEAFLHSKFLIVDRRLVWTGSWNATINDTYRNNNNLLRLSVPALVENYSAEFEQLFARVGSTSKRAITPNPRVAVGEVQIANYFSPQDSPEQYIVERIAQAERSVRFLAFSFTSDPVTEAMIARHAAGLTVEGVMEERNAEGVGAEYGKLREAGIEVLRDGNCYTMHHKIIIIDGRTVITGSFNFTGRANELNVENLLIIDDPTLAARYDEEFARVWRQAESPTRCG